MIQSDYGMVMSISGIIPIIVGFRLQNFSNYSYVINSSPGIFL
jgi:hypothetical protein